MAQYAMMVFAFDLIVARWRGYISCQMIAWIWIHCCCRLSCWYVVGCSRLCDESNIWLYPHRKFWRSLYGTKFPRNFKRPKNGEDGSDFDDFWTKRIAALSAKFWKKFGPSKKFPRGRKIRKTFAKSSKNFVPRAISDEKQNRNGQIFKTTAKLPG